MTSLAAPSAMELPPTSTSCSATATAWHPADRSRSSAKKGDPPGRCSFTFQVAVKQLTSRRSASLGAMAAYASLRKANSQLSRIAAQELVTIADAASRGFSGIDVGVAPVCRFAVYVNTTGGASFTCTWRSLDHIR